MTRTIGTAALALGAVLAWNGLAAADDGPAKSGFGTTMTLGGKGTAAQAAAADDTELTHGRRYYGGYYGGYRNYYGGYGGGWGGYGYRSFYPGYYGGYGYGGGFRPSYYSSYYSRSYYYQPAFSYYGGFGGGYGFGGYGNGCYFGINGTKDDAAAPLVSLALKVANSPAVAREPAPAAPGDGTFRYDGGPASPVPQPAPEARSAAPAAGLPVSLPKTAPAKPYTYKAYGEK